MTTTSTVNINPIIFFSNTFKENDDNGFGNGNFKNGGNLNGAGGGFNNFGGKSYFFENSKFYSR